jgi:hypothetical protein
MYSPIESIPDHGMLRVNGLQGKVDALKVLQAQTRARCAVDALLPSVFLR